MAENKKATQLETNKRVDIIFDMIIKDGAMTKDLLQFIANNWDLSDRQAYYYVEKATAKLEEIAEKNKNAEFGKAITRNNLLFNRAFEKKDYKTCLEIQKELNKMFGNYEPVKIDNTNRIEINKPIELTDEQFNAAMEKLTPEDE